MSALQQFCQSLLLGALLLVPCTVYADRIVLKSGRVMVGKVTEGDDGHITIKTDQGITARFKRDLVVSIEKAPTPRETYEVRKKSVKTTLERLSLARFCAKNKLPDEARLHYQEVIEALPNQREAREYLGYVPTEDGWTTREAYMTSLGLVKYKGHWTSETERDLLIAAAEARRDRSKVRKLVREAVNHKKEERREKAEEKLEGMSTASVRKPFRRILVLASRKERSFVLNSINERAEKRAFNSMLARSALADPSRGNRRSALDSLESKQDPNTALYFTKALSAESPVLRINAASALMRFPDRRAVGSLIVTMRMEAGGFGRAHFVNTTQRAYIRDFELASGGSGLTVAETADPVVGTFQEGTVLDVKIRKVEWESRARVLEFLTGESHGTNQVAWKKWYKKNKDDFVLSPEASKRRGELLATKK